MASDRPRPALAAILLALLARGAPAAEAPVLDRHARAPGVGRIVRAAARGDGRAGPLGRAEEDHEPPRRAARKARPRDVFRGERRHPPGHALGHEDDHGHAGRNRRRRGASPGRRGSGRPVFPGAPTAAEPGRPQGRDHRRGPPHDELDPRVQRLERASRAGTRSACTRSRTGCGSPWTCRSAGSCGARSPRSSRTGGTSATARPASSRSARSLQKAAKMPLDAFARRAALPSARHRARGVGPLAARPPDGRRRAPSHEPRPPEARSAPPEQRRVGRRRILSEAG